MINLSGKIKQLKQNCWIFAKTLVLLWKTNPANFIFIFFVDTIIGLTVPAKLWVWKEFIDAATKVINDPSTSLKNMFLWLAINFFLYCLALC